MVHVMDLFVEDALAAGGREQLHAERPATVREGGLGADDGTGVAVAVDGAGISA